MAKKINYKEHREALLFFDTVPFSCYNRDADTVISMNMELNFTNEHAESADICHIC